MRKIQLLFISLTIFFVPLLRQTAHAQTSKQASSNYIVAGRSAGKIKISATKNQVFQLYSTLKRSDYYESKDCPGIVKMDLPGSLRVYFQDGRVSQILVQSDYPAKALETAEKIKPGSTPAQVKKYYPNANKAFTKLGSSSTSTGYAPLIYWVDYELGIAFEFYTDSTRGRLVNAIHVFAPNGKILFEETCEDNKDLRELPAFALKIPEKMIRDYEKQF